LEDVIQATELREQIFAADDLTTVVACPALRIGEHFVCLRDLSEAGFRRRIAGVRVGMGFACEVAERALDLVGAGVA
jgi:hypothetical protein